mgnify:CR=1 FL=1
MRARHLSSAVKAWPRVVEKWPSRIRPVWAPVAGAFWAGYIVLAGPLGRRWEGISGVAAGSMLGTLLLAAPVLLTADGGIGTPGVWLTMAAVALLSSVVPYGLEVPARRSITALVTRVVPCTIIDTSAGVTPACRVTASTPSSTASGRRCGTVMIRSGTPAGWPPGSDDHG